MESESLIHVINKLQNVFRKTGEFDLQLPQIVVVGSQSCGKSSVLESFVGSSFLPRGTGIVTRCPIVLQLNRLDTIEGQECTEYCSFGDDKKYTDFEEVRRQIELRTDELAGSNKGIAMESIIVEVFSPKVVPLTVVDLPGLVKNKIGKQPANIEDQVKDMILKYIQNPRAIILAVSPANADIATSESIKIAKEVDPEGRRTLAVITKLDLMDKGTDASDVLNGSVIPVKLGIVGVVNRSQYAIDHNVPMKDALNQEQEFFRKTYPDLHKNGTIGSGFLARRLNELLLMHIQETLPTLIKQVKDQLDRYESRQRELGPALAATPEEKAYLLMDVVADFINKFKVAIKEREPVNVGGGLKYYAVIIADIFENFNKGLNGQKKELEDERVYKKIEAAIRNSVNVERFTSIEEVVKGLVKEQLNFMQGPSYKCAEDFCEVLSDAVSHCLVDKRLRHLNSVICQVTKAQLADRLDKVKYSIQEYILTQTGMIFSCDEEFTRLLMIAEDDTAVIKAFPAFPLGSSINAPRLGQLAYIHKLICGYLSVVRRQTADYIPKHIMRNVFVLMTEELKNAIRKATHGKEDILIVEPPEIARKREANSEMFKNLHEAMEIISDVRKI